jgi:hypothetical protein
MINFYHQLIKKYHHLSGELAVLGSPQTRDMVRSLQQRLAAPGELVFICYRYPHRSMVENYII